MAGIGDILALDLAATAFDTAATETPAAAVTYTPVTGSPSTPDAVILVDSDEGMIGDDGEVRVRHAVCYIEKPELAAPAKGDTIAHGGENWTVQRFYTIAPGLWEIHIQRHEIVERSREDFRLRR